MNEHASFSEQLAELRRTRFADVPRVRYVMQSFLASSKHSVKNRTDARKKVLDWAKDKWPGLIPPQAYEGKEFEYDQAGLRIAATSNADATIWAFRSEHQGDQSRNWVTEAVIADLKDTDAFGVRNSCATVSSGPVPASSPRFLREFIAHHALHDAGQQVVSVPHMVVDANGFDAFLGLLLSSDRILPVVVLTEIPAIHEYAINAFKLAMDIQGLAHVFCMDRKSTFDLTDRVGCLYAPKSEPEPAVSCIDI